MILSNFVIESETVDLIQSISIFAFIPLSFAAAIISYIVDKREKAANWRSDVWGIICIVVLIITICIWIGAAIDYETFFLPAVIATIALLVTVFIFSQGNNCPKCNKRYPNLISSEYIGSENIQLRKTVEDEVYNTHSGMKTGAPKQIIKRTITIPGIRKYYHNTYRCKKCGYVFTKKVYEDSEI